MKIAILMFGQPRFLKHTVNLIKEEFDLPGHDVHYYAHFWNKIGYTPNGQEIEYDKNEIYNLLKGLPGSILPQKPSARNLIIQDYEVLDSYCHDILKYINLHQRNLPISKVCKIENLRYKFGQHVSMKQGFKRIVSYEKENNFKYDIIIKVRTDIVYQVKEMYESEDEYYKHKLDMYTNMCFDIPLVKGTALRYVDLIERRAEPAKDGFNIPINYFYKNKLLLNRGLPTRFQPDREVGWIPHTEDYNKRLAFNDWTLIANRAGAEIMFENWFENYFITHSKDILNNNTNNWFISMSDHCLQGQFALNYNLALQRISPRRDARLIHPEIVKRDIKTGGKIKAESEEQIRKDILNHKFR
tara:strand:+ start:1080 stop:2150 length:1071 start_codon:yes stop_codon:yes gene_type:complete